MNYEALKKYKKTASLGLSNTQCVALLLEKVADHVGAMMQAIDKNDVEIRVHECNRALLILRGLEEAVSTNQNESMTATTFNLKRYYSTFQNLIFKSSTKNDRAQASSIEKNLRNMATFWRSVDSQISVESTTLSPESTKSFCHSV